MSEDGGETCNAMDFGFLGSLEPTVDDAISDLMIQQLGSSGRSYKRENRRAFKALVSEVYSPPRVTAELQRRGRRHLLPGFSLDLTTVDPDDGQPWDFTVRAKREKARALQRRQKPYMLIGSPECTAFCTWQALNESRCKDPDAMQRAKIAATLHILFVIEMYHEQISSGRHFLHEHPRWASSWKIPEMEALMQMDDIHFGQGDQCQYGAEVKSGKWQGAPIMKPTGFLSSSEAVIQALGRRCTGVGGQCSRPEGGTHYHCHGVHAKAAAIYPRDLCRAILDGVTKQLRIDRKIKPGCWGLQAVDDEEEIEASIRGPAQGYSGRYKDDLTGQVLNDSLVHEARMKELEYFYSKNVWVKVPRRKARAVTGHPPITVRWVDVNKGDELHPKYRSRLVARQLKALDKSGQSYFAPAPPLEALRTVLSLAATTIGEHKPCWDPNSPQRTQISFVDVSRAYFNAKIDQDAAPTFVDLPPEDDDHKEMCARLLSHMYGTRPAADGWQQEYSTLLISLGFRQGISCPNVFHNAEIGRAHV
jgi:hypothetical protein